MEEIHHSTRAIMAFPRGSASSVTPRSAHLVLTTHLARNQELVGVLPREGEPWNYFQGPNLQPKSQGMATFAR